MPLVDLIIGACLSLSVIFCAKARWRNAMSANGAFAMLVLMAVTYLIVLSLSGSSTYNRHFFAFIPIVALMLGVGVQHTLAGGTAMNWRRPVRVAAFALAVLSCMGLALRAGVQMNKASTARTVFKSNNRILTGSRFDQALARDVKQIGISSLDEFSSRVVRLYPAADNRMSLFLSREAKQGPRLSFAFAAAPGADGAADAGGDCLAVLPAVFANLNDVIIDENPFIAMGVIETYRRETPYFTYVGFATLDGNCPKNLTNTYIETTFERRFLTPQLRPWRDHAVAFERPGLVVFTLYDEHIPHPIGIELSATANGLGITLHGHDLRGFSYFAQRALARPTVTLEAAASLEVISLPISQYVIGRGNTGRLTPWSRRPQTIPPGSYRVILSAVELENNGSVVPTGPWSRTLGFIDIVGTSEIVLGGVHK